VLGRESGGRGVTLTLGDTNTNFPYAGTIEVAKQFGNTLELKDVDEMTIDTNNKGGCVSKPY